MGIGIWLAVRLTGQRGGLLGYYYCAGFGKTFGIWEEAAQKFRVRPSKGPRVHLKLGRIQGRRPRRKRTSVRCAWEGLAAASGDGEAMGDRQTDKSRCQSGRRRRGGGLTVGSRAEVKLSSEREPPTTTRELVYCVCV